MVLFCNIIIYSHVSLLIILQKIDLVSHLPPMSTLMRCAITKMIKLDFNRKEAARRTQIYYWRSRRDTPRAVYKSFQNIWISFSSRSSSKSLGSDSYTNYWEIDIIFNSNFLATIAKALTLLSYRIRRAHFLILAFGPSDWLNQNP